jgi:hypothetical protein
MMLKRQGYWRRATRRLCPLGLLLSLAAVFSAGLAASEVYTWTDESGTVHYSDTPRQDGEMQALEVEEIYRPGSADAYTAPPAPPDAAAGTAPPAAEDTPQSAAQKRRESLARERSERREAQAEIDRMCALHRQRLEQMEPARRVFYTDAQGESVRMDDDKRMALIDESKAYLAENCKG